MEPANAAVVLSPDVLWEILLLVPTKPLCLFRAVCRLWRSILSDPSFVKAHAAVHPDLIVSLAGDNDRIDMTDLSGNIVRQISIGLGVPHPSFANPHPGPLYLFQDDNRVRVVDPDTGAASTLPFDDIQDRVEFSYEGSYTLGWVASTGQHKVFRVVSNSGKRRIQQHCHVLTLGDDCWRPMASAPLCVMFDNAYHSIVAHNVVIQGVVYFLPDRMYPSFELLGADNRVMDTNCIMSFDLDAEEWRPATLPGPQVFHGDCELKLAKLNGSLVMLRRSHGCHDHTTVEIDMWFATDLEKGVWVKEHSIRLELPVSDPLLFAPNVQLSSILDDGRVVFFCSGNRCSGNWSWLDADWRARIYDPITKSCTDALQHGVRYIAGMYR